MDETTDDGGSAFALTHEEWNNDRNEYEIVTHGGLTKREWFAGMALQGAIASFAGSESVPTPERFAEIAYAQADAMLAARRKP